MSVVFLLIIIGIVVASIFLIAFIWAVKNGQFDDSYTPSVRILFDDKISTPENNNDSSVDNLDECSYFGLCGKCNFSGGFLFQAAFAKNPYV